MLRVMQTRPGTPHGNCRAACYAFIFELALDDLPDSRWPEATPWQEGRDPHCSWRCRAGFSTLNIPPLARGPSKNRGSNSPPHSPPLACVKLQYSFMPAPSAHARFREW